MNVGVLISGTGTNLQALLDAEKAGRLAPANIAVVISNRPGARGLERASAAGKPTSVVDHREYRSREQFEQAVLERLESHRVEAVVLAGFMRILTPYFIGRYPDRIINIHPALLPAFPGLDAQQQAFAHGVKIAGCTVHLVDAAVDHGAIVLQAAVPVLDDDDEERLRLRILEKEHDLLPRAVQLLAAGRLRRQGRRVLLMAE
ncbi:MAG: phosphoribosylglycinamide formyltransferase [Pseudomonadota bacterium]